MKKPTFYPSYIPRKWIHYANHKKKRIRKKYQNRIRRTIYLHDPDLDTMTYKIIETMSTKCGYNTDELSNAIISAGRMFRNSMPITPAVIESTSIPENNALLVNCEPRVEIPGDIQRLNDILEQMKAALEKVLEPVVEALKQIIKKFTKWSRDFADCLWCNNRHWWNMAKHHKKYRIRKKYRNKINRAARQRLRELFHFLQSDDDSTEDSDEASDDEEVP